MNGKKTLTIELKLSKNIKFLLTLLFIIIIFPFTLGSESLKVETYYPTPYGSYDEIVVSDYIEFGGSNLGNMVKAGNIGPSASIRQGIEASSNIYLQSVWAVNIQSNVDIVNDTFIKLCRWVNKTTPQCNIPSTLPGGTDKWQPVALAYMDGAYSWSTYYNTAAENPSYNYTKHNRVLCCRFQRYTSPLAP